MVCDNCELVAYLVLSNARKVQRGKKANAKVKHRWLWGSRGGTDGSRIRFRLLFSCIALFSCSLSFRSLLQELYKHKLVSSGLIFLPWKLNLPCVTSRFEAAVIEYSIFHSAHSYSYPDSIKVKFPFSSLSNAKSVTLRR